MKDFLDVKIEKIVPGGFGLAFAENLTVFVALAAVGDHLRVRVNRKKGKVAFAEIVEIIESAPDRQTPPCPYFGKCGGCDFQQMNYAAQLRAKKAILEDCLKRIGKINYEREIPILASFDELNYRSRAQWHVDSRRRKIGYFARHSHDVIDVECCPILAPALQKTLTDFRVNLNFGEFSEAVEIETAASGADVSVYSSEMVEPTREIFVEAGGERYFFDATAFFQGNRFLIEPLVELAAGDARGALALDLYCGVGLFTLPLARKFTKVFGVETSEKAVGFAGKNVENARLSNVELAADDVSDFLRENAGDLKNLDFLLLDPPRAGAEREIVESILQIRPKQISYVSCDPATLARDLRVLTEDAYRIESIAALDLFPQTHHVETVARLTVLD